MCFIFLACFNLFNLGIQTPIYGKSNGEIKTDTLAYDFGTVLYNSQGSHIFMISNSGTSPLIITNWKLMGSVLG
jgi:hypothetical protein